MLGADLSMNMVNNYMVKTWNFVKASDLYYHEKGYFLDRLNSYDDREPVLMKGLYTIRNMPMILKE